MSGLSVYVIPAVVGIALPLFYRWGVRVGRRQESCGAKYPHDSGDCIVLGPEIFTNKSSDVVCYKGQNYYLGDKE